MSWIQKLLPPKIKRVEGVKKSIPEGLWCKCPSCEAVLYSTDLESNQGVCPKCSHHHRMKARARLDALLDEDGRYEIGSEVLPTDILKFKDSKRYPDRLLAAHEDTGEADALIVNKTLISEETMDALPNLKYIGVTATGYNNIDTAAALRRDIPVCNVVGYGSKSVAQHTFALILELTK